ncbi:MAG: alanine racemase [Clostridiales bacterium]|nr:alanine racemase [Clostridiales bacterium]
MNARTYVKVDLDALEFNFNSVRNKLPEEVKILGVIKADAYGHGAVELGRFLEDKCDFFGVACIEEALELKQAGIKTPILILGKVFSDCYSLVVANDIRIPIFCYEDAKALSDEAVKQNKTVPFHFCIDTGMTRIGFQVTQESTDICKKITALPGIFAEGLFSHYATADESDLSKANRQREKYIEFCNMLDERNVEIPIKHLSNSAGIMNFDKCFNMCRMGIVTYGLYPSHEVDRKLLDIKPLMSWYSRVSHVKTVGSGVAVSYGGTFVTKGETKIATVPIGYADGYSRRLSNLGKVLVNGQYANVIGRVCMDQFMINVTGIDCGVGDEVVLVGKQGDKELSMDYVSELAGSFNYELPCIITKRVTRVYTYKGKIVKTVNPVYNINSI